MHSMVTGDSDREINKGQQTMGFERGYLSKDSRVGGQDKVFTLDEMRVVLREIPDFNYCPTCLEQAFSELITEHCGGFSMGSCDLALCP